MLSERVVNAQASALVALEANGALQFVDSGGRILAAFQLPEVPAPEPVDGLLTYYPLKGTVIREGVLFGAQVVGADGGFLRSAELGEIEIPSPTLALGTVLEVEGMTHRVPK